MLRKISKKVAVLLGILIIGGLGGVVFDRYFFPYLSMTNLFKKYDFLKRSAEETTIINKTEQVYVKEETSINKISNQASSSVVDIISYAGNGKAKVATDKNPNIHSNGTGVIVTSDGMIMTYADAINLVDSEYKVITYNGDEYAGELIGVDAYSNLAFIKISASNLPTISFGNSDDTKSGEKIIAIGNKLDSNSNKYVAGIISSFDATFNLFGRDISSSEKLEGVFGSDFAANSDIVGGPIVDYSGQVIGIVGSRTQNNLSAYFGIPSNKVKVVIDRAIRRELDKNPKLGLYYVPLTRSFALKNGIASEKGAVIYSPSGQSGLALIEGYPAKKAGLQLNDIITKVNDKEIDLNDSLSDALYQFKAGDEIELTVMRAGQEIKVEVQL
jgi:serine protease Do